MDKILRVNVGNRSIKIEPVPEAYWNLGGRALTSRIICEEVPPTCDPLGAYNKLVFAPGLLSGTVLSSSSRLSVGCKSPLTGGIKESNSGGQSALKMAMLGYKALIVEGAPEGDGWWLLVVERDGARFEPADEFAGMGAYETAAKLFARYGAKVALSLIGTTGQRLMNLAGICNTDPESRPSRLNARGGPGAVMGSKKLLAVVWNEPGSHPIKALDDAMWKDAAKVYLNEVRTQPGTSQRFPQFGTAAVLETCNKLGGLPIRGFRVGQDPATEAISGIRMAEVIKERGGETTHSCMTGCAIQCSNVFVDKQGKEIASSMEFETNDLLGANLAIFDFDAIAGFTYQCNDLGIDTIETGGSMMVAMEAGLIEYGDADGVNRMFEEIRAGSPTGRILGMGAGLAGKALGVRRVPVVKNQTMSAYDPRVIKGNGVTFLTSAMGADHTAGNTIGSQTDHLDPKDKVAISKEMQIVCYLLDIVGFCNFARGPIAAKPESFAQLCEARLGKPLPVSELRRLAIDANKWELDFNVQAGHPRVEKLPEWMQQEPLAPHNALFDVSEEEMAKMWDEE
ncbi:MAG TPA: aldehyde ferredoxin oxidoreductase N-terminal domain-containing protein [Symbiobacteriaceae bacterium]|nr:aldehyde ferredoxin oxidoreductase N-terminal domain-containing protein [Symbiobacteriaceae bacterium]